MPFLSIRRRPAFEMRRRTQRFSLSTQKRRFCRFGRKRRLVLLLAWETLLPLIGAFPVTWHTRAMRALLVILISRATEVSPGEIWPERSAHVWMRDNLE